MARRQRVGHGQRCRGASGNAHRVFQKSIRLLAAGHSGDAALGHQVNGVLQSVHKQPHIPHHRHRAAAGAGGVFGGSQHGVHQTVGFPHTQLVPRDLFQRGGAAAFRQAQYSAGVALGQTGSGAELLLGGGQGK